MLHLNVDHLLTVSLHEGVCQQVGLGLQQQRLEAPARRQQGAGLGIPRYSCVDTTCRFVDKFVRFVDIFVDTIDRYHRYYRYVDVTCSRGRVGVAHTRGATPRLG